MERPKKPASGFLRFLSKEFKNFEAGRDNYREFQAKVAQDWKVLPDEKKQAYNDEGKQESVLYKQELAKWELKMIRLGHTDLVRNETLIDGMEKSKRVRGKVANKKETEKKNKADSSDSDWKVGWCQNNSLPDAEHFKISLSEHQQDPSISSHPPKLPTSGDMNELHEMTPPQSSSDRDKDTTSEKEIINNSKQPPSSDPPTVPPSSETPENQPPSKGTIDKLKKFFKF